MNSQDLSSKLGSGDATARRDAFLKKQREDVEKYYDGLIKVKALIGKRIGMYVIDDHASKDVMAYLLQACKDSIRNGEGILYKYGHKDGVGLVMKLNERGENLFFELDSLDERITQHYRQNRIISFEDNSAQRRDILSINNRTRIAQLVGGEKRTSDHTMETIYSSTPHVLEGGESPLDASELFVAAEPIICDKNGKVANDTHEFVTRRFNKRDYQVGNVPRATLEPAEMETLFRKD